MPSRVLVAGVGNMFLRDDGFGSEVVRRLARERLPDAVRLVDYGIRGVHLAYDLLDGYDSLVLVDALPGPGPQETSPPGSVHVLEVRPDDLETAGLDAHGMDPLTVLSNVTALGGRLPHTVVVGCVPFDVEEGIGLSEPVAAAVPRAVAVVHGLLSERVVV